MSLVTYGGARIVFDFGAERRYVYCHCKHRPHPDCTCKMYRKTGHQSGVKEHEVSTSCLITVAPRPAKNFFPQIYKNITKNNYCVTVSAIIGAMDVGENRSRIGGGNGHTVWVIAS